MTKAVLFDFDETLQDRTLAFEGYMDAFLDEYLPNISQKEREAHKQDMRITGNGGYVNRVEWCTNLVKMWGWENAPDATVLANHYDYNFGDFNVIFEIVLLCLRLMCDIFYFVLALFGGLCIVCCFLFLILIFRV